MLHSFEGNVSLPGHDCFGKGVSGSDSTFGFALGSMVGDRDVLVERLSGFARTGTGEASGDTVVLSGGCAKNSDVAVNRDAGIVLSEYMVSVLIDFNQLFDIETI
jgi:hypothetical protein